MSDIQEYDEYRAFPVSLPRWQATVIMVQVLNGPNKGFYMAFRHLCEMVGVASNSQTQNLKDHPEWYPEESMIKRRVNTPGGFQEMLFLRKREAGWWIGHLNPNKVKASVRDNIEGLKEALMQAADRLAFGDVTDVPKLKAPGALHVYGEMDLACPRCGCPINVMFDDEGTHICVDED